MLLRVSAAFFPLLSLKYLYISFFRSLPDPCLLPCSPPPLPRRVAIRAPLSSLPAVPFVLSPSGTPLKLPGGLPSCLLCLVVLWWLPLLVRYQAQNGVTMWADAPRICPRPCLLLPMCCRVFRVLSRGFRPCVRVCVLLPCVVWR